jgi:hypothetical protein
MPSERSRPLKIVSRCVDVSLMPLRLTIAVVGVTLALAAPIATHAAAEENAADLSVKSDERSLATLMETYLTDHSTYPQAGDVDYNGTRKVTIGSSLRLGKGNRLGTIRLTRDGYDYCLRVVRADGAAKTTKAWSFVSDRGGIRSGACPDRFRRVVVR